MSCVQQTAMHHVVSTGTQLRGFLPLAIGGCKPQTMKVSTGDPTVPRQHAQVKVVDRLAKLPLIRVCANPVQQRRQIMEFDLAPKCRLKRAPDLLKVERVFCRHFQ